MNENTNYTVSERTEIFDAAERDDLEAIKRCEEKDETAVTSVNFVDETVAHVAVKKGNLNIVKYVLGKYPFISTISDTCGNTVLSLAVEYGYLDIVKYLVEHHKADISQPFKRFFRHPNAVHLAAESGHLHVLKYFVEEKKADVNATNAFREPLVFAAARKKHIIVVKYLFEERNADLTMTDTNGDNILYLTVKENDLTLMKYILDEKKVAIDVNWKNHYGRTLLHLAAFFNNVSILSYLVEEKLADVNIVDNKGQTPLHRAAHSDRFEASKYLIEHGANIKQKDRNETSPLEKASNDRLIEYMKNATRKRNRRSISASYSFVQVPLQQVRQSVNEISWRSTTNGRLEGCSANSLSDGSYYFLNNLLEVCKTVVGVAKGSVLQAFLSPQEITERRMDPLAMEAVRNRDV